MAPGRGHPLNAALAAWVESAHASAPDGDWSGAVAAYLKHSEALFAEAAAKEERGAAAAPSAKKASPSGGEAAAARDSPDRAAEEGPKEAFFFGQRAAEPPASREANPFAQGLDFGGEARHSMHRA